MKLVLIGWHGADWKALHPLLDAGRMPHLLSLIERGVAGNLKATGSLIPASLWTSIATGKGASQHGIQSASEADPLTGGTRPVSSIARRVKALWNIAMQSGLHTCLVGWSATHPAEQLNGCCLTPAFVQPLAPVGSPWPVLPNSVYPARLSPTLAQLRVHAGELTARDLRHFIPSLTAIDQETDRRVLDFADTLAQTISIHAAATWLLEHEPWDLMMVGFAGLERACHTFMRYAPPQLPGTSANDCAHYGGVVTELYCYFDALIGRILQLAGPDATVAIVSAAGFRSREERPTSADLQAKPAAWYRPYGIFCMAGPNIAADQLVHNVTLFDVAPTMLSVLNLPAAQDMPGRVIAEAFLTAPINQRIASWEQIPGDSGMHSPDTFEEAARVATTIAELAELGYSSVSAQPVHLQTPLEAAYNHFRSGNYSASRAALSQASKEGLAAAHSKILESHLETAQGNAAKALAAIETAERLGFDRPLVNWAAGCMYLRHGDLARAEAALRQAIQLDPSFEQSRALLARVLAIRGKSSEARDQALAGLSLDYASASLHSALGIALLQRGLKAEAMQAFETSLAFDPQSKEATAWTEAMRRTNSA